MADTRWDVVGLGNALMDALVVLDDDEVLQRLGLVRGIMHPVDHDRWEAVYAEVASHGATLDSGGSCANTIATIGRLGARARYCGQVGNDRVGHQYADLIATACGGHALTYSGAVPSGKCLSLISADAERTMVTDLGASIHLADPGGFRNHLRSTQIAHFTGYTLLDGAIKATTQECMAIAHDAGARVSLDVADPFVVGGIKADILEAIARWADIVFLNAEEALALTGLAAEASAPVIAEQGDVTTVVVKLGAEGSLVWDRGEVHRVPVTRVRAIDTTGAGDAYAGGFLYGVVQGWSAGACGALASEVGARTVTQIGANVTDKGLLNAAIERARPA